MRRSTVDEHVDFEALYRHSRDDVYAYVAALVRDRGAAEEVTATAFERALRRRASYAPQRGSARAWLFGIARNAAYDELRRLARTRPVAEPVERAGAEDPTGEEATRRAALATALAGLEEADRELIALKFQSGLSNAEIGAVLEISESNAGTRLSRAVAKLRTAIG